MFPPKPRAILRNPWTVTPVLILGLALSLAGALIMHSYLAGQTRARVEAEATNAQEDLLYTVQTYRDLLLGFRALASAPPGLNRERFHQYYAGLELKARHPGLLAVSYGLEVPGSGRDALERTLRKETADPALTIHPQGRRDTHFVLIYAEPPEQSRGAVGMDTRALPGNVASLDQARDTGNLVLTGPMKVVQYQGPDPGMVMRLPIYRAPAATLEARRQNYQGCVSGVFRLQALFEEALSKETLRRLDLDLEDLGVAGSPPGVPQAMFGAPLSAPQERIMSVYGRLWRLRYQARPDWVGYQDWLLPAGIGASGCIITLLLWGLVLSLSQTGQRARLLALTMTEQVREHESRTEAMAMAVPDPVAVLDEEGRFLQFFGQHEAILGLAAGALQGTTVTTALPGPAAEVLMHGVRRAVETRKLQTAGFNLTTAEGRRDFEGRILAMGRPIDGRRCVVLSLRDITDRTRAEEITRTRQKLESLGVLAGGIAHDFNNFLTAIIGHINLAQEYVPESSEAAPRLRLAETSALRAAELTHQMLAYSGKGSLKVDLLELNRVVEEMTELLAVSISKKARLEFSLAPGLPLIMADAVQIQQVVMNLVTNASDALGDQNGTIRIETRLQEADPAFLDAHCPGQGLEPGRYALLRVTDSGCGMDEETRKRIFDPFFTTKSTGRGLGLSALLGILKGHGAGISIRSEPGGGSEFEILLPSAAPGATLAPSTQAAAEPAGPLEGLALVADDEAMVRSVMVAILEQSGLRVLEAADGQEAMDLWEANEGLIDLVLLDITMPRMDGNETFRAIRARAPQVPVILLSGFTNVAAPVTPPGTAPAQFVQKPFRTLDLEAAVHRALHP